MKKIEGIWKNSPELSFAPKCDYFCIGKNKVTYHVERLQNNSGYKWVAKNPSDISDSHFAKSLQEISNKLYK
jgi:hypothetical protein